MSNIVIWKCKTTPSRGREKQIKGVFLTKFMKTGPNLKLCPVQIERAQSNQ